jgi:hypothetical protein
MPRTTDAIGAQGLGRRCRKAWAFAYVLLLIVVAGA